MFNKTNLFIIATALAGLAAQSAEAIIVRAEVWRKQREDGSYQYVLGASDAHYSSFLNSTLKDKINVQDLSEKSAQDSHKMIDLLVKHSKSAIKVILEDWNTLADGKKVLPVFLKELVDRCGREFLDLFAEACSVHGLDLANVECRQKRLGVSNYIELLPSYCATAQAVEQLKQVCENKESEAQYGVEQIAAWKVACEQSEAQLQEWITLNVDIKDLIEEFDRAIMEIKAYKDGEILSAYYAQEVTRMLDSSKKIREQMSAFNGTYLDFLDSLEVKGLHPGFLFSYPILFGKSLLDMKALHQIYHAFAYDKKDLLIVMGGAHINNICMMLQKLGYEKIDETGCGDLTDLTDMTIQLGRLDAMVEDQAIAKQTSDAIVALSLEKFGPFMCGQQQVGVDFFAKYLLSK